jgi:hypothetical protein
MADDIQADEAEQLIQRALDSVLQTVPEIPGGDVIPVESAPNVQPWAETAAPQGRNKRSLDELLEELRARVASAPSAIAGRPSEKHPGQAYLDSLAPAAAQPAKRSGQRRWRGRTRRGGGGGRRGRGGGQRA